jgi:hypothetical protein
MIRRTIVFGTGITLAFSAAAFGATTAAATTRPPGKAAPTCGAITFRPLPPGMADGEQQAGMYRSRNGRLELRAEVKQGNAVDYFVTTGGKRIAAAPATLPEAAGKCAAAKKLPKPEAAASPCTGQRFKVVVAHAGEQRLALLYAEDGSTWRYCSAGTF